MSDLHIRTQGQAGRITLTRPKALNSATQAMLDGIDAALDQWRDDDSVALIILDAEGDKAFCAGGDIADLYAAGRAGDFGFGRTFWAFEYRLNAKIATYPKPIVSLMQGFTMGGGVGLGCHASHRIVGETSQIAMPECGIGLVPDVGGSHILAQAQGRLGEYLGLTGARMGAGDAIGAGFADTFVPQAQWPALIQALTAGDVDIIADHAAPCPDAPLHAARDQIDAAFAAATVPEILAALGDGDLAQQAHKALTRNSPLAMEAALILIRTSRQTPGIEPALTGEYRYTWRASEEGDFLEGIRAAIIDKDRSPNWKHQLGQVTPDQAAHMVAPLGANDLNWT